MASHKSGGLERGGSLANERSAGQGNATEQLKERAGEVRENLQEMGALARDAAQEGVSQLRDTANQYYNIGRDRAMDLEHSIESRIREKPVQSILAAAGVGMLVGILWMRR